jgi:hypothetical protein
MGPRERKRKKEKRIRRVLPDDSGVIRNSRLQVLLCNCPLERLKAENSSTSTNQTIQRNSLSTGT